MGVSEISVHKFIYETNKKTEIGNIREARNISNEMYDTDAYNEALTTIQKLMSENHSSHLSSLLDDPKADEYIKPLITKYLKENKIIVAGLEHADLVEYIFDDMAGMGILKGYIYSEEDEEINGQGFDDIETVTANSWRKIPEKFASAQKCEDMIKKLCKLGGIILDEKNPTVDSYISNGVRISAIIWPIIDKERGAVFSIRKQKNIVPTKEQLIRWGTATEEEIDFLVFAANNRISIGIAGATSSGKTTDLNFILQNLSFDKRIYTIEDTRELNAIKRDKSGNIVNRVIHTKTRKDEEHKDRNVDEDILLKRALRFHPYAIVPAEMRGGEAMTAVEAGRTGHMILTSFHAESAKDAYARIYTMCLKSGINIPADLLMDLIIQAFPIMVFKKQCEDKSRKYMKIIEAEGYKNNKIYGRTLYKFIIERNEMDEAGRVTKVVGKHKQIKKISNRLAYKLLENGANVNTIRKYAELTWDPSKEEEGDDDL